MQDNSNNNYAGSLSGSEAGSSSSFSDMDTTQEPKLKHSTSNLDLTGASIAEDDEAVDKPGIEAPSIDLPKQRLKDVNYFSIDIGGSLIKLVYFASDKDSRRPSSGVSDRERASNFSERSSFDRQRSATLRGGRLHFKKFETSNMEACKQYIKKKRLNDPLLNGQGVTVKATGGGSFKYADEFERELGVKLYKEDEMRCLVSGCNFLLKAIPDEAFTYSQGVRSYVSLAHANLYPYLLVNIGSGVSMLKVSGENQYDRISGTNIGGGTFFGLCQMLTGVSDFDEMLRLSMQGDNTSVDMLVGDIYGGNDYSKVGLAATTIASSFGKVMMEEDKGRLPSYKAADMALSLLRMISYNIGQLAVLNAMQHGLQRIFFGGFFIRGHPYTLDVISYAINYWSKGAMKAMFMRHEGFLGALGAFLQYEDDVPRSMVTQKGAWVEKFIASSFHKHHHHAPAQSYPTQTYPKFTPCGAEYRTSAPAGDGGYPTSAGAPTISAPSSPGSSSGGSSGTAPSPGTGSGSAGGAAAAGPPSKEGEARRGSGAASSSADTTDEALAWRVGVLHLVPSMQPFPLLADPTTYEADTIDMMHEEERIYWIRAMLKTLPGLVEKAVASVGGDEEARRGGEAFRVAFLNYLNSLSKDPAVYGKCSFGGVLEFREECLREYGFMDAYSREKKMENMAALEALPELLAELDEMQYDERLLALTEGVLAGNIFDWGSAACVELYKNGTILEIYRKARADARRPWRIDHFDDLAAALKGDRPQGRYKRAVLVVDNSGADIVLGIIPFARELLHSGTTVILVANSMPAINDITVDELHEVLGRAAGCCRALKAALSDGRLSVVGNGSGSPCLNFSLVPSELAEAVMGADLLVLEGMGRMVVTNLHARFVCDTLKVAMIKNERIAEKMFGGKIYDSVCKFEPAGHGVVPSADPSGAVDK